nr:tripartite motif-containing protein 45-like [Salvelinus alpinus]
MCNSIMGLTSPSQRYSPEWMASSTDRRRCGSGRLEAVVVDNSDGSYSIAYTPVEPGSYSVWVCVKAQHVKVSPFVLNVKRKVQRHCGMFHMLFFLFQWGF